MHGREEYPENLGVKTEERPNPGLPGSEAVLPTGVLQESAGALSSASFFVWPSQSLYIQI